MIGFLTGVAVLVILSQLGDLTGYSSDAGRTLGKALDVLLHPGAWDCADGGWWAWQPMALMIVIRPDAPGKPGGGPGDGHRHAAGLDPESGKRGPGRRYDPGQRRDTPAGAARTAPDPRLLLSAFAIALIGLIQASGVSQAVPNPDGEYGDASRDFSAQGIANIVSGLFRGLPLGGSLGGTGIILGTGAKSRWANVFVGLFVAAFVLSFRHPGREGGHAGHRRRVDRHRLANNQPRRGGRCLGYRCCQNA